MSTKVLYRGDASLQVARVAQLEVVGNQELRQFLSAHTDGQDPLELVMVIERSEEVAQMERIRREAAGKGVEVVAVVGWRLPASLMRTLMQLPIPAFVGAPAPDELASAIKAYRNGDPSVSEEERQEVITQAVVESFILGGHSDEATART